MFANQVQLQSRHWRHAFAVFGLLIATAGHGVAQIVPQSSEIIDPTPPPMQLDHSVNDVGSWHVRWALRTDLGCKNDLVAPRTSEESESVRAST